MKTIDVVRILAGALLSGHVLGLPAQAAGLNCSKANNKIEYLICDESKNPGLYALDSQLNIFFKEALARIESESAGSFIEGQKKWLKNVRNACGAADCLRKAYQSRVSELQEAATLCSAKEVVVFSCTLPGRKVVSLCASPDAGSNAGYMQYRSGRERKDLEILFPPKESLAKKNFKFHADSTGELLGVSFWSGADRFSLFSIRAKYRSAAGLIVSRGHPPARVSYVACQSSPVYFDSYQRYAAINFHSLDKALELPDVASDFSYSKYDGPELRPGDIEQ